MNGNIFRLSRGERRRGKSSCAENLGQLYNLDSEAGEQKNVVKQYPEVAEAMAKQVEQLKNLIV